MNYDWINLYNDGTQLVDPEDLADRIYSESDHVLPARENVFKAFDMTKPEDVKVVIIGQDPYHTPGQAQGLAFSIPDEAKAQPSIRNILKELKTDLGIDRESTDLTSWAEQGVLLINSSLTVLEGQPGSHKSRGWELFTQHMIKKLNELDQPIVFILWGNNAQEYEKFITNKHVIKAPHPSPFSARRGFFGSKPFSQTNAYLTEHGVTPIEWGN